MKKLLMENILVSLAFIVSEPIMTWCDNWADSYSLGAEMALGMLMPVVLFAFILFIIFSVSLSLHLAVVTKDIKQTIPILALIAFAIIYIALSNQDSLWIRVFEYYKSYGLN